MSNLANILTLFRLVLLPFMIVLFFVPYEWAAWLCLIIYAVGAVSDFFDGWIARKFEQVSEFGKFMDPISDKIFVATVMLMLVAVDRINGIMVMAVVIILAREFTVSGLREFLGPKDIKLPVTNLAKWKTAIQMTSLGFLIIAPYGMFYWLIGNIGLAAAAAITAYTGWLYVRASMTHLE